MGIDREKVIKAIEDCVFHKNDCVDCDYDGCVFKHGDCRRDLLADALALLKKQEPRRAIRGEAEDLPGIAFYVCPACRIGIDYLDRFCRHCGQELKWE